MNPQIGSVYRTTMRRDCFKTFKTQKNKLINELHAHKFNISCTFDIWQGRNQLHYYVLTAHYIDSTSMLQKIILDFGNIEFPHNAIAIFIFIMSVLQKYGIKNDIFSITFDNAINNTAAELFNRQLKTPVGKNLFHVRCVYHIINLIIKDGSKFFEAKIQKIRNAILYIRSSAYRYQDFKFFCKTHGSKNKKFPLNTDQNWNTTYLMLQSIQNVQEMISLCVQTNQMDIILHDN